MSETLFKLAASHGDKVATWYKDSDGYWLMLQYGWQWAGCHSVHEHTVKEVLSSFRDVEPCECLECRTQGEQWEDYDIDTGKRIVRTKEKTK